MTSWRSTRLVTALIVTWLVQGSYVAAAQEIDWTRAYLGGQIGYTWDGFEVSASPLAPAATSVDMNGLIGGVQGGANFVTLGAFVIGLSADFNWLSLASSASFSETSTLVVDTCGDGCIEIINTVTSAELELDIDWKSTVRTKVGLLATPNTLIYATGGVAFAHIEATLREQAPATSSTENAVLTGFVVGLGAETFVTENISLFLQVLHYEFADHTFELSGSRVNVDLDESLVEAGVSFYFN